VVATNVTAQGVEALIEGAVIVTDAPEDFAAAVTNLAGDAAERERLGCAALKLAQAHFSPSACYSAIAARLR
jgi:glycosyltransferase involved in cell wall biosynthesis